MPNIIIELFLFFVIILLCILILTRIRICENESYRCGQRINQLSDFIDRDYNNNYNKPVVDDLISDLILAQIHFIFNLCKRIPEEKFRVSIGYTNNKTVCFLFLNKKLYLEVKKKNQVATKQTFWPNPNRLHAVLKDSNLQSAYLNWSLALETLHHIVNGDMRPMEVNLSSDRFSSIVNSTEN